LITGSALKAIVTFFKGFFRILFRVMTVLGLWIPFVYAVFGLILFFAFDFNPFDQSIDAWLYIAGFGITLACALVIAFRNLVIKPSKNIIEGYRYPVWKRDREGNIIKYKTTDDAERYPPERVIEYPIRRKKAAQTPEKPKESKPVVPENYERPKIYYSARERDTLVHEYSDRFEVFRIVDGKTLLHKVEYKHYDL